MSDDKLTHTVQITVTGNYPHGEKLQCSISMAGNGGLEHMISAFQAILVAAGFSTEIAKKLGEWDI